MKVSKSTTVISLIFALAVLVLLQFIIIKVNFMQNDDWVHYRTVNRFLRNDFTLDPVIGSTFYVQGIVGFIFSLILGIQRLPVLTYLFSLLNFFVFTRILYKFYKVDRCISIILGLMLFFNPLHFYLSLGFMVENYLLSFVLFSWYFYCSFTYQNRVRYLVIAAILALFAFLVKQLGIVLIVVYVLDQIRKRDYKPAAALFIFMAGIAFSYYYFFPRSITMIEKGFDLSNATNGYSLLQFAVKGYIYLVSFALPLVLINIVAQIKHQKNIIKAIIFLVLSVTVFLLMNNVILDKLDYPYLSNTFTSKGFFPGDLAGNKYHFTGSYDLFRFWKLISVLLGAVFLSSLIVYKREKISVTAIFILFYFATLFVLPSFFDRYLVILVPFILFFLVEYQNAFKLSDKIVLVLFVVPISIVSLGFAFDYIKWQGYVWNRSEELVSQLNIPRSNIIATRAWNKNYEVDFANALYKFSFDNPEVLDDENAVLIETEDVNFWLSPFIDAKVYLYKLDDGQK